MKHWLLTLWAIIMSATLWAQNGWFSSTMPTHPLLGNHYNLLSAGGQTLYVVGKNLTILKSTDGGQTWVTMKDSTTGYLFGGDFANDSTGWVVGTSGRILFTNDGGNTWHYLNSGTTQTLEDAFAADTAVVYVVGKKGVILKSTDGGKTWRDYTNANWSQLNFYGVTGFNSDTILVVDNSSSGIVIRTTDGGATWEAVDTLHTRLYHVVATTNGTAYIAAYGGKVFQSTDYGENWTQIAALQTGTVHLKRVSAPNSDVVWVGGSLGDCFRSIDGGANWDTLFVPTAGTIYGLIAYSADHAIVLAANGQLFETVDGGHSFIPLVTWPNVDFYAISKTPIGHLYAVSESGGEISLSTNGGNTWSYPSRNTTRAIDGLKDVFFVNDTVGYAVGYKAQVLKTTNGGTIWHPLETPFTGSSKSYNFVYFWNADSGFVGGSSGKFHYTYDGGQTWTEISAPKTNTLYDAVWLKDTVQVACASSGKFYRTSDGQNWVEIVDFGRNSIYSLAFANDTLGIAAGRGGIIYRTTNGGKSWVTIDTVTLADGSTPSLYATSFLSPSVAYIGGTDGIILKSTDGGQSWNVMPTPNDLNNASIEDFAFYSEDVGVAVATNGYILGIGITGVQERWQIIHHFELKQNYPNPFNPSTTIAYSLPKTTAVELIIYNMLGQKVRTLVHTVQAAGQYQVTWNGRDDAGNPVSSGFYFYQLRTLDGLQVKKMLLLK